MNKLIKTFDNQGFQLEVAELKNLLKFFIENESILKIVGYNSITEFESYLLSKTGWANLQMSADAMGYSEELKTLQKNEALINGKIKAENVVENEFTDEFLNDLKEKHTTYLNDREIALKKSFDKILDLYKKLEVQHTERHLFFDNYGELKYSPFSFLRNK
jgi:hypothetical protein